jgi:HTH-type transcriptional regulator/antitoxin HipB
VDYPLKTPHQLRPLLVGFRKAAGLTQTQVAARLGVTQQTYAQLEAKPESASLDRLFHVLKILKVSIVLTQTAKKSAAPRARDRVQALPKLAAAKQKAPVRAVTKKREDW